MPKFADFFRNLYLNNELLKAITASNLTRVRELLDNGADVNGNLLPSWNPFALACTYWRRYSPLHCALGRASYEIIEELVNRGANVNEIHYWLTFNDVFSYAKATTMELALVRFSRGDQDRIIQLFLENGFNITSHGNSLSAGNALQAIDRYRNFGNEIADDEPPLATASLTSEIVQKDYIAKKGLIDQIENNPDNAEFTKKQSVPSLFFLSAKKATENGNLPVNIPDIKTKMQQIEENAVVYSNLKPQVEAYEEHLRIQPSSIYRVY